MCLGVICTAPYAHGSTFKTTNMPTCTRSTHTSSRRVHISMCSTYFASHISSWSRCHLLARNNADHSTVARLHFFSKRFGGPCFGVVSDCSKHNCTFSFMFYFFFDTLQVFQHGQVIAITRTTRPQPSQHYSSQVLHRSYSRSAVLDV